MSDLGEGHWSDTKISNKFIGASDQLWTEEHRVDNVPACTVRYNRFEGEKYPVDERYLGTKYADPNSDSYDRNLFFKGWDWSGITYEQKGYIRENDDPYTNETVTYCPNVYDKSFQAESGLHNYYGPDEEYHHSKFMFPKLNAVLSIAGVEGVLYDAKFTNWTQSYQVEINDPETCIAVRNEIEKPLPEFNLMNYLVGHWAPGEDADEYAKKVWAKTGVTGDLDELASGNVQGVEIVDRETRLEQDRESGQLKPVEEYKKTLPSFYKP